MLSTGLYNMSKMLRRPLLYPAELRARINQASKMCCDHTLLHVGTISFIVAIVKVCGCLWGLMQKSDNPW